MESCASVNHIEIGLFVWFSYLNKPYIEWKISFVSPVNFSVIPINNEQTKKLACLRMANFAKNNNLILINCLRLLIINSDVL